jgi:hypothetical protein
VNTRQIAVFQGPVQCLGEAGAVQWCIRGVDRDSGMPMEVLLSGAAALQLPVQLRDAELHVRDELENTSWELRGNGAVIPLPIRAAQVHRYPATDFAAALPRIATQGRTRAGWWLLLNLLRVPGMTSLLRALRGRERE